MYPNAIFYLLKGGYLSMRNCSRSAAQATRTEALFNMHAVRARIFNLECLGSQRMGDGGVSD